MIVLPAKNEEETAFEFKYKVSDTEKIDWWRKIYLEHFADESGQRLLYIVSSCLGVLICLFFCSLCTCCYYCCCKPKVIEDPETGRRFSRRRSSRGDSFASKARRSMRLESIVSMSGQSFRSKSASIKRPTS